MSKEDLYADLWDECWKIYNAGLTQVSISDCGKAIDYLYFNSSGRAA